MQRLASWVVTCCALLLGYGGLGKKSSAVEHEACSYLDIGDAYWDASPRASDEEDFREEYGRNEDDTSYPAQRWLARVTRDKSGTVGFGWASVDDDGCATVDVPNLSIRELLQTVAVYFPMRWVGGAPDDSFFVGLDLAMQGHLPNPDYQVWAATAQAWGVAQ